MHPKLKGIADGWINIPREKAFEFVLSNPVNSIAGTIGLLYMCRCLPSL